MMVLLMTRQSGVHCQIIGICISFDNFWATSYSATTKIKTYTYLITRRTVDVVVQVALGLNISCQSVRILDAYDHTYPHISELKKNTSRQQ